MAVNAVIDASAIAAVLFVEAESRAVEETVAGRELFAPSLLPYEIASVGLKKLRRGQMAEHAVTIAVAALQDADVTLMAVDMDAVLTLAVTTGLSAYDASYLWLARQLNADLITLDNALAAAAGVRSIARTA